MIRRGRALVVFLALAGALRLLALLTVGNAVELHGDEGQYWDAARSLADGRGYPGSARPPAYPLFLAAAIRLAGPSFQAARLLQIPLSLAVVALVFDLTWRRFGSTAACWSGLLAALSPTLIHYTHYLWAETLLAALLLLALRVLDAFASTGRRSLLLLAGVVVGLATLTREMCLAWVPFLGLWIALRPRPMRRLSNVALLLLGVALPILPWTLRNHDLHGTFVLVSTTRWYPTAEGNLLASQNDLASRVASVRELRRAYYGNGDELARERDARQIALATIASEQPLWLLRKLTFNGYLLLAPMRNQMRRFAEQGWLPPRWAKWGPVLAGAESLAFVVTTLMGLAGLWLVPGDGHKELGVGLLLAFLAVYVVANATHRFRVPLLPIVMLWAGPLLAGKARIVRWRVLGAGVTLAAFGAVVLFDLLWPPTIPFPQY